MENRRLRHLVIALACVAALSACGNKGPLVKPSAAAPEAAVPAGDSPPSSDATGVLPLQEEVPPPVTDPAPVEPLPEDAPPPDSGGGNG